MWDDVVHSDMAGYLFDLGMDGLGLICDTGSLFKNAVTLNWGEAALDLYGRNARRVRNLGRTGLSLRSSKNTIPYGQNKGGTN